MYEIMKALHALEKRMYNVGLEQMRCSLYENSKSHVVYASFRWNQANGSTTLGTQRC
jgi:hypothetical protein